MSDSNNDKVCSAVCENGGSSGCMWKSTIAGLLVAILLSWTLLSVALSLPFFLGLFFFMLFGLIIGAVMFRFANPHRPVAKSGIVLSTAVVSLICWAVALYGECVEFPEDFADRAIKSSKIWIPDNAYHEVREQLNVFIVDYLKTKYPPGGVLGYLKMTAVGDPIEIDIPNQPKVVTLPPRATAASWWIRVVLSLVLLYVAVYAVTCDLAQSEEVKRSKGDDPEKESGSTVTD